MLGSEAFQLAVPGRAYLISYFEYKFEIFEQLQGNDAWNPYRRQLQEVAELPLADILKDSNRWDSFAEKVDGDESLKQDLYALGRTGDSNALQVVRRRLHTAEDESVQILLEVVLNHEQYFWLNFLEDYTAREDVKAVYLKVYNELLVHLANSADFRLGWSGALVQLAIGLEYQERAELDPLLEYLLFHEEAHYEHFDQATNLLAAKADVTPYAQKIHKCLQNMKPRENRMPGLAEQLFRAGIYEIPEGILLQSAPNKSGEQYANQKIGIKSLDRVGDSQYDVCRVERLFNRSNGAGALSQTYPGRRSRFVSLA